MLVNSTHKPADAPTGLVINSMRAKQLRDVARDNGDGSESTVLFTSYDEDGKYKVVPTLFPKDPETYTAKPADWMELPFEEAIELAEKRGEVFVFDTQEQAEDFAQGNWKDVSTHEAEALDFYRKRGMDYESEKQVYDKYMDATDIMFFLDPDRDGSANLFGEDRAPFNKENLSDKQVEMLGNKVDKLYIDGKLRQDAQQLLKDAERVADRLSPTFLAEESQLAREEFDLYLNKRHQAEIPKAIEMVTQVKQIEDSIVEDALENFNLRPEELVGIDFEDPIKNEKARLLSQAFEEAQVYKSIAADKYYNGNTYYDMKHNKAATKEYVDNWDSFTTEWSGGYSRGQAGDVILAGVFYPEILGGFDLNDPESTQKMAEKLVMHLQDEPEKISRVMSRYGQARTSSEIANVILSDPLEWATSLAAGSLSQMLPYGWKIMSATIPTGAATGAVIGAPAGGVGAIPGAITGGVWGFRTGMAATSLAMEYTNEMIEAIREFCEENGSTVNDAEMVALALQNQSVWDKGRERGLKRGIPIAMVDMFTSGLAGKILVPSKLAGKGSRVAGMFAERLALDPFFEGVGEYAAQVTVGDDIDWKEIYAEAGGAVGNNTSNMSINLLRQAKRTNNIEKAAELTRINDIINESASDSRISEWGNNMERLGQISPEENKRIQDNVGLRKTANELLSTGRIERRFQGKGAKALTERVMQLLAAKQELSSTTNRKELFSKKIGEINDELNDIITTKKLKPKDKQTMLEGTGVLFSGKQTSEADIREAMPTYKLKTNKFKRAKQVTKEEMLNYIESSTPEKLNNTPLIKVSNDSDVNAALVKKMMQGKLKDKLDETQAEVADAESISVVEGEVDVDATETVAEEVVSSKTLEEVEGEQQATEDVEAKKQKVLEDKVEELIAKDKSLRDEDGSVSDENKDAWKQNKKEIQQAKENARRGNMPEGAAIAIRKRTKDGTEVLTGEESIKEEIKIEALIQEVLDGKKTAEEVLLEISNNYGFPTNDLSDIRDYINDRTTDAPEVGNNKQSFTAWIRGKMDSDIKGEQQATESVAEEVTPTTEEAVDAVLFEEEVTEDVSEEEQSDIDNFFDEENESSEVKGQNLVINKSENAGKQNTNPFRSSVIKTAELSAKAISKILPKVKIVMHETNEQYLKYAKLGEGRAEYNPDNTTIHINLSKATKTTVPHEIFHAVLMEKVKSDPAIARAAEQMVLSVQKIVSKDSDLGQRIEKFAKSYEGEFQNEERLAELVGILSSEYRQLDKPSKNVIIKFLKGIARKFGIDIGSDFGTKDADVIDLLNVISRKTRTGEVITEADVKTLEELDNGTNPIGSPTTIVKPSGKQQVDEIVFKDTYKNSLVSQEKKVDFDALIDEIVEKDQKVWFWVADQLGIDEEMGIDGGPSFAHQNPNDIWASSMAVKGIENNISKTDYLFIISGSPTVSKLFNKSAYDFLTSKLGDFNTFKAKALEAKPIKVIRETLENYDSWQELRETTDRKPFLIALNNSQNTPNTDFTQYVESINGYTDLNTMRDGFYAENGFEQNDIMLILKPTGVRAGSNHSTYENTVEGEVIGVPNRKVNALDIMPEAMKAKYTESSRSQASQVIAPYGSGRRSVSKRTKTTDTKSKPKVRQQKSIEEIARYYNMNTSGFLPNQVDVYRLKKLLPPGFGVKQSKFDSYGRGGSYYIVNAKGYKVNPYKNKRRQQKDIEDYIIQARQNNFKANQIRDFLVRTKKFPVKLVDKLMKIDVNLFDELPKSFGSIKGGIEAGIKLYSKVEKFRAKETKLNSKRKNKLSEQQIVDKTIEFLEKQSEYIAESEFYNTGSKRKGTQETKRRVAITQQQARMLADLQASISVRPTQNMGMKIAAARLFLRQARKGRMDLQKLQSQVRNLIRKTLPKELYEKKDVLRLIDTVNESTEESIENTLQEVVNFVIETNVKSLEKKISDILNDKYQEVDKNNKLKPKKIVDEIKKRIDFIKANILGRKATKEQIGDANLELLTRFNELMDIQQQTEEEQTEMVDIQLAMQYNNAMLMDNDNPNKVTELDSINITLGEMINFGRSLLKEELLQQHQYYNRQFTQGYEAITGDKIDMSDPDAKTQLNNRKKQRAADEKRKALTQSVIRRFFSGMFTKISNYTFGTAEAMDGLMMRIDKLPGEMFGGRLNKMFTDRVDESSRRFKGRMLEVESILAEYLYETLGKNWKKISRKNRMQVEWGIELNDGIMLEPLSQDQIAYLYNMYKDPANRASFSNPKMWGVEIINKDDTAVEKKRKQKLNEANAKRIMSELETKLDPKVKEIANWQVEVLYPALYAEYNKTYKKLYRTDLPWNKFYSGTIYRDGFTEQETDVFNALGQGNMYKTAVGANATKVRQKSNLPIKSMNQMDVLNTYINNMEYFAAYGETIRDMDKFFSNEYVKGAIKEIHGNEINVFIKDMITKVAQQGQHSGMKAKVINGMNNTFILSRLALSPVITIKQLTSTFTYANDIGPLNWLKYAAKNKTEQLKVWKEVTENSIYMKDRNSKSIMRAIETYTDSKMKEFVPRPTKDFLVNFMMYTTKIGDRGAIILGGLPNYSYYKANAIKKGKTEEEAIQIAIKKFERDTKRTQQSADLQDKDYLQTGEPITRAMNMFLTTPKQYLRKEIIAIRELYRKLAAWDSKAGKGTVGQNLRTFAMYHFFMPVLFQYVAMGLPGILRGFRDDDDEDLLRAAVIGNLNALFIIGELVQTAGDALTDKPWAGSQAKTVGLIQIANGITRDFIKASNYKDPEKKTKAYRDAYFELTTLTGLPMPTIAKFFDGYSKLDSEPDVGKMILRLLNYSNYQIEGPQKKGSSKTTKKKKTEAQQMKELKIIDKDLYNEMYGPGTEYYEEEQELKRIKKEQDEELKNLEDLF